MENQRANPLSKYFRQPALYLKLPSNGRWWNSMDIDIPDNRELPIYPMSARDEIILKTPDALLNGQGMVDVIQSCVPNIKNAWGTPSVDLDALLISMRIASYGSNMDFESNCTHCKHKNLHGVDLTQPLSQIRCPNFDRHIEYRELKIKLKPQSYKQVNQGSMINFEEQKIMTALSNESMDELEKSKLLTASVQRLIDLGIDSCVNSTEYIKIDETVVSDRQHIADFYKNSETEVVRLLQKQIQSLNEEGKIRPFQLKCESCEQDYQAELTFDYSSFFAQGF
jgi:hypothetical protein